MITFIKLFLIFYVFIQSFLAFTFGHEAEGLNVIKISRSQGMNLRLKCKTEEKHCNVWIFAPCENCNLKDSGTLNWTQISESSIHRKANRQNPSTTCILNLINITPSQNGLYRCNPWDNRSGSTSSSYYKLTVMESKKQSTKTRTKHAKFRFTGRPPEIIDLHASTNRNIKIKIHETVLLTCTVSSPLAPKISWLKECEGSSCDLSYSGHNYYNLNTTYNNTYPLSLAESMTFIGKIKLHNFTSLDNGVYVCLALTDLGKDYRNITLSVEDEDEFNENSFANSFIFLSLVPLLFILLPACVWFCYFRRRKSHVQSL